MASDTTALPGRSQFPAILRDETRPSTSASDWGQANADHKPIDALGRALSRGGVRSAAFSLGRS